MHRYIRVDERRMIRDCFVSLDFKYKKNYVEIITLRQSIDELMLNLTLTGMELENYS